MEVPLSRRCFACLCEAVLERTPCPGIILFRDGCEGNRWLDLCCQMPGPTCLPLQLCWYAVRETSVVPRVSFHCITSVREVIDFTFKAMQNRSQGINVAQKSHKIWLLPCSGPWSD
ncbi:hypothetical protein TraAM80_03965 [Trypanosoma rangeli]|uniref:Uncharacterized protein n=1 Tax=Trypanosoma rangeli TaxID=5698 RepID=A0A3S5IRG3_TRYRA|nr:uncharacterized protein TraAM80_03965 [Trypanosoma rangeli]RNF06547.1 hypothetical protein TraAM80_03965 [Trypanosoma rangeli]|eukprot:RNF06547.1 hypothetical protein TraAM80_03965 [Trypanosoma rangeli]